MALMEARGGPRPTPGTLNQLFFDAVSKFNRPDALQAKVGGAYRPISHAEVAERVRHAARGLSSLGVRRGDRVAIFVSNKTQAEKIREIRTQLPALRTVIGFDEIPRLTNMSMAELEQRGTHGENRES